MSLQVLVLRDQPESLDPAALAELVRSFDPGAATVWRDQATNPWERHKALHMGGAGTFQLPPPRQSTLVLGKGEVKDHYGLTATLGGARAAYGSSKGSQVIGGGKLQWHLDGAFWSAGGATGLPCRAVGMRCVEAPGEPGEAHEIAYVTHDRAVSTVSHPRIMCVAGVVTGTATAPACAAHWAPPPW